MRASVRAIFPSFTASFEGYTTYMYLDVLGNVTTGAGNLIDPMSVALTLPWKVDGAQATAQQIANAWQTVKNRTDLERGGGDAYAALTNVRLSTSDVDILVTQRLLSDETELVRRYPSFESWPADAQLGILSMAWAMGPDFNFPEFRAAINRGDFLTAAAQCHMSNGDPDRNAAQAALFTAAAAVLSGGGDVNAIHGPISKQSAKHFVQAAIVGGGFGVAGLLFVAGAAYFGYRYFL